MHYVYLESRYFMVASTRSPFYKTDLASYINCSKVLAKLILKAKDLAMDFSARIETKDAWKITSFRINLRITQWTSYPPVELAPPPSHNQPQPVWAPCTRLRRLFLSLSARLVGGAKGCSCIARGPDRPRIHGIEDHCLDMLGRLGWLKAAPAELRLLR